MEDIILECRNVAKNFFGVPALTDVSFKLRKGHVLGLIGENGAGKSTLMNILGGVLNPDMGELILKGNPFQPANPRDASGMGIEFIHQELNLFHNLTIAENIYINRFPNIKGLPVINKKKLKRKTQDFLNQLGMDFDAGTRIENLSPGERQLVEIAKALSTDADIIIFDEPTTSLTTKEIKKLFDIIAQLKIDGKSIIYISHILEDIIEITDDLVILRDGHVVEFGSTKDYPVDKMISFMVGRDLNQMYPDKHNIVKDKVLLAVNKLSQHGMVKNISVNVREGEVVGIFGLMGSGRTELVRMIFGMDRYSHGSIEIDGVELKKMKPVQSINKGLAIITEDRRDEGLLMDSSIVENLGLVALPMFSSKLLKAINVSRLYNAADKISGLLKLKAANIRKQLVKSLSGGNQQKVVIGKWLMGNPKVLIMDEPTRGIDVGAKYEIYTLINDLASKGSGILVISSEVEELIGTCDRIIVMNRGEIISDFEKDDFDQEKIMRAAFKQDIGNNTHTSKEGK